jgi:hypothetical protein
MLPIIATVISLAVPAVGATVQETDVRARATEPRAAEALPGGEIISEAPPPAPARSLRELMRVRLVLPEGVVSEHPGPTTSLSLREMHEARVGDLGLAIP